MTAPDPAPDPVTATPEGTGPTAGDDLTEAERRVRASSIILCDASSPQAGTAPYHIGYGELVDGYRHAWTEVSPSGRRKLRHGRTSNHPHDSRCPECTAPPGVSP